MAELPGGERSFDQPWELRAFAIAVAAYHAGSTSGASSSSRSIDAIRRWEADGGAEPWSYYEHWLTALETVLAGNGALSDAALDYATKAVLATPPNRGHHKAHREPVAIDPARSAGVTGR